MMVHRRQGKGSDSIRPGSTLPGGWAVGRDVSGDE